MKTKSPLTNFVSVLPLTAVLGLLLFPRMGLAASDIACGQTVTGMIRYPSQIDSYTFAGISGQMLSVGFYCYWGPPGNGTVRVYNPSGGLVTNVTTSGVGTGFNLTLASSGTYTFRVQASVYTGIANYNLSIQSRTGGGCLGGAIACGQSVSAGTLHESEMDAYSCGGAAGEMLSVGFYWGPSGYGTADIYNPSGQWVTNVTATSGGNVVNLTLASSGTYTILVHESNYAATSAYTLSLQSRTGGGCFAAPIACGQSVARATQYPSELDAFSYAGTAGQMLSVGFFWSGGAGTADIYNPSGQWVTNVTTSGLGNVVNLTLASSGTYTILVHDSDYSAPASYYTLSIQSRTGGGCGGAIACGQSVSASTSYPSELDAWSYAGTAGQMLSIGFYWPGGAGTADIYDPSGQWLTNVAATSGGKVVNLTLASSGTYTILVHASNYNITGSYTLSIQSRTGGGCGGSIACGQSVSASTSYASELDAWSYAGTAGQMLSVGFFWRGGAGPRTFIIPADSG